MAWHQLDHAQNVCSSVNTDNHVSTYHSLICTHWMHFLLPNQTVMVILPYHSLHVFYVIFAQSRFYLCKSQVQLHWSQKSNILWKCATLLILIIPYGIIHDACNKHVYIWWQNGWCIWKKWEEDFLEETSVVCRDKTVTRQIFIWTCIRFKFYAPLCKYWAGSLMKVMGEQFS